MKRKHTKRIAIALAIISGAVLTGCGQSSNNPPAGAAGAVASGVGACVPLTSQMSFTASGATVDSSNLYAGQVPSVQAAPGNPPELHPGNYGQVIMGSGTAGQWNSKQAGDGQISLNITNGSYGVPSGGGVIPPGVNGGYGGYGGYAGSGTGTGQAVVSGMINISPAELSVLQYQYGGGNIAGTLPGSGYNPGYPTNGYNPGYPTNGYTAPTAATAICVNGIALDLGLVLGAGNNNPAYYVDGLVYLYINNTGHGAQLYL